MLRVQWDTLRSGNAVIVHVEGSAETVRGIVAIVTPAKRTSDANEVAVRVEDGDESYYLWPAPGDVHADPDDGSESCVQCGLVRL